jgi:uncharacterized protein
MIRNKSKKTARFFNRKPIITSPLTTRQALILIAIELSFSALFMLAAYVTLKLFDLERPQKAILVATTTFAQSMLIIIGFKLYLHKIKISWNQLGLRKPHAKMLHLIWQIPVIILLSTLVMATTAAILNLPPPEKATAGFSEALQEVSVFYAIIAFFSVSALTPFIEEVIFRGIIYGGFKKRFGVIASIVMSAFIFAVLHGSLQLMPYFMTAGIAFALVYEYYKTLWASIFVHIVINSMSSLAIFGIVVQ